MRLKVNVTGIVQGVGFRPFVYRTAVEHQLTGYVRNRGDAGVEILLEGERQGIQGFLDDLRERKPPLAHIHGLITSKLEGKNEYQFFKIEKSSAESELSGSVVPPDIAICGDCLKELRDPRDPRHDFFFITCTNCGPRFTIIERLPYDRENTTMREFQMCSFCSEEYTDPFNRRFHAQTVACPECGPKAYLTTRDGEPIHHEDPIREAGRLLSEGNILAVKGYGGFHIATSTALDKPLIRLREVKHRSQKPFAIMAKSLDAVKSFAVIRKKQEELMTSYVRPIVLLDKADDCYLSGQVAPGLHNIGVMLPYSGLHYMLFDRVEDNAFVMTSANPPNQPIVKDNNEALSVLSDTVDYFLFHNRLIAHRCDDSVLRVHGRDRVPMRRSRGCVPAPIIMKLKSKYCILALGGELNNTVCLINDNKAFISQHIGDVENVETMYFLESAAGHLIDLTNSKVDIVACDLHPKFTTTSLAQELAMKKGWQVQKIQHHYAHIAALMTEHNIGKIIGICCDGYGYGTGGEAWGGEIVLCDRELPFFKRLTHLQKQPLLGGDLATRYPLRIAAGILYGKAPIEDWLYQHQQNIPHGRKEAEIILQQLKSRKNVVETTSCGRVLDAVAAILGVCYERTYEGEAAMKLESAAVGGKDVLKLRPVFKSEILDTTSILQEIFSNRARYSKRDLAYSAHVYLARGLAEMAIKEAKENQVHDVGFSGGVACNEILTQTMRKIVEDSGVRFNVHRKIPPGDGGLSFGQAAASGFSNIEP